MSGSKSGVMPGSEPGAMSAAVPGAMPRSVSGVVSDVVCGASCSHLAAALLRCLRPAVLTPYQIRAPGRPTMRALVAAAIGLAPVLLVVLLVSVLDVPPGETSPKPLYTTVPGPKK